MNDGFLYLDNNATTRVDEKVVEAMIPYFTIHYANPSGLYKPGEVVKEAIQEARQQVCSLLNCQMDEVIFVGCGTEADNTALHSAIKCKPHKNHLVISSVEHPAVKEVVENLKTMGYSVTKVLPNREGVVTTATVKQAIQPNTALVSIMAANNETGVLNPIYDIGAYIKSLPDAPLYHIDATQAVGKTPIDFARSNADYMAFSGHKFHGPKGIGVLLSRRGSCYKPLLVGGSQEQKCRAGTENVPGIVGLGKAAVLARQSVYLMQRDLAPIRDWLESELQSIYGNDLIILGKNAPRTPNTTFIAIRNANGRKVQKYLSDHNIIVGTGSACSCLKKSTPSDTVLSMRVPPEFQRGTLRISLSKYNLPLYGGQASDLIPFIEAMKRLRALPLLRQ